MARKTKVLAAGEDTLGALHAGETRTQAKRVRKRVSLPPAVEQALVIQSKLDALLAVIPETGYDAVLDILSQVPIMLAREMAMAIAGVPESRAAAAMCYPPPPPLSERAGSDYLVAAPEEQPRPQLAAPEGKQRFTRVKTRDGRTWTLRGNPNGDATGFIEGHHPRPDSVSEDAWITDAGDYQWIIANVPDPMEAALADGLAFANGQ